MHWSLCASSALFGLVSALAADTPANIEAGGSAGLHVNQIQVIGTHNSYHVKPPEPMYSMIKKAYPAAADWDYTHAPLDVQLERGVRSLELDVYHDPAGTKVMHVPQYDNGTTCKTFVEGLQTVHAWSQKHPKHVPISILVEVKDEKYPQIKAPILPFDKAALDQLDREVRGVFKPDELLTPDDVRGNAPTLSDAIRTKGWPLLDAARGKVMLILHEHHQKAQFYTDGAPSLQGREMFMESEEGKPYASVFICNEPSDPKIPELVKEGYIVRTRADADLKGIENGNTDKVNAALASGANIVSTDFPPGEANAKNGYVVTLPGNVPGRVNPVNGRALTAATK